MLILFFQIMPYDEKMLECRLGYSNLHVIPIPPENLPPNYVTVSYTCPCGDFSTEIPLHRYVLYHMMGRTGRLECEPQERPYVLMLSNLQAEAILAARSSMSEDEEEEEKSPDR